MNRYRTARVPTAAAMHKAAFSSSRGLKITLITLDNYAASGAVYLALTAIRKDCGDNRQKAAGRAFGSNKPAQSRNPPQCWLAYDTATETSHGVESRTQAARADHHRRLRGHQYRSARPAVDRWRQHSDPAREGYIDA